MKSEKFILQSVMKKINISEEIKLKELLYEICDSEHSSCNSKCPVYKMTGTIPMGSEHEDCICFKDGSKMLDYLKTKNLAIIAELPYIDSMRQRLGLKPNDSSKDAYIGSLSLFERVRLIAGWEHGDEGWPDTWRDYFESQGLYLTTDPEAEWEE